MKIHQTLLLIAAICTGFATQSVMADSQPTPVTSAPAQPPTAAAPAVETKKPTPHHAAKSGGGKKPAIVVPEVSVPLTPGPATVVATRVNVRGKPTTRSEVITRLTKGDAVTVLEEITHNMSRPDEPSAWAKIIFPASAHVWVSSIFVDATNKTVLPKKLNMRTGPGENYSIAGVLQRGETVKEITAKDGWLQIETPTNAIAYIAAAYLRQGAPAAPTTPIAETAAATPTAEPPAATPPAEAPAVATATPVTPAPAVAEEPPPKRVVSHEGIVRGAMSIQAPTGFALVSPDTGKTINYLYTSAPNLDLRRYKGLRIIVTGEEGLDERWMNTPVITIQRIQVVE